MDHEDSLQREESLLDNAFRIAVRRRSSLQSAAGAAAARPLPAWTGQHNLGTELGRGGMAIVVSAHDDGLDRDVALKILGPAHAADPILAARFLREARILARLQHPGIVPIHEQGRLPDGRPWFSMPHVKGETLGDRLARCRTTADGAAETIALLAIFESVCQTVAYAHHEGVIHGDLKPANIMLGQWGQVLVLDWGLAQVAGDPLLPEPQRLMGTPAYMAPELARGSRVLPDTRSDVFSLGAMLCEILTGAPPWNGATRLEILSAAHKADLEPVRLRLQSSGAENTHICLVLDCLARAPETRLLDASQLVTRLATWREQLAARVREAELARARAETHATQERRVRRRNLLLACAALLLLLGSAATIEWIRRVQADEADALRARLTNLVDKAIALRDAPQGDALERTAAFERALALLGEADAQAADAPLWLRARIDTNLTATRAEHSRQQREASTVDALRQTRANLRGDPPSVRAEQYARIFNAIALPVDDPATPVEMAGKLLGTWRLREELVIALDDWARLLPRDAAAGLASRLVAIANAADPDPLRIQVRALSLAGDRESLLRLAAAGPAVPSAECQLLLAQSLFALDAQVRAEEILRGALDLHPTDARLNHLMGTHLAATNDNTEEGLRHLWLALAAEPSSLAHRSAICTTLLLARRPLEARRVAQEMLRLDPASADAHQQLGGACMLEGQHAEAIAHFDAAIVADPGNVHGHALKGLALRRAGDMRAMLACMRDAYKHAPRHPLSMKLLSGALQDLQQHEEALPILQELVAAEPLDPVLRFSLARTQSQLGRSAEAAESYMCVTKARTDWAEAWCNLGLELRHCGRFTDAVIALRRGHELGSARGAEWHYPSAGWLADAATERDALARLATLIPADEAALPAIDAVLLGRVAALTGDASRAARLLSGAEKHTSGALHEGSPPTAFLLARTLIASGDEADAPRIASLIDGLLDTLEARKEDDGRMSGSAMVELARLLADGTVTTWFTAPRTQPDRAAESVKRMTLLTRWQAALSAGRAQYLR